MVAQNAGNGKARRDLLRPERRKTRSGADLDGEPDCRALRLRRPEVYAPFELVPREIQTEMTKATGVGRGGARPGAGRPKGRKSASTLKRQAALRRAAAKNLMPVEY